MKSTELPSWLLSMFLVAAMDGLSAGESPPIKPGQAVDYSKLAFQPEAWHQRRLNLRMTPWTGRNVVFLTVDGSLDPALMGLWVSRLDAGWQLYTELTGRKPLLHRHIDGRVPIAAVPDSALTCGAGCGYIGATGIELAMFYDHNYPELKADQASMPHYVFYEMGRNFYTFGNRHSCFITGFAVFMRYVCMDTLGLQDPDAATRKVIEGVELRFAASGLGFLDLFTTTTGAGERDDRIRDAEGRLMSPSGQTVCYASAMLRLYREQGGNDWLKRFYQELGNCPEASPDTREGALAQGWHWMLCASLAARRDLSPVFAGEWRLPVSGATRNTLAGIDWGRKDLTVQDLARTVKPEWVAAAP